MPSTPQGGVEITENDHGPAANLAAWISMVIMILASLSKVFSKLSRVLIFQLDNFLVIGAMLMAVGQTIAISMQVSFGLGQHIKSLTAIQIENYEKTGYVSQILYLVALFFSKMTTLYLLNALAQNSTRRSLVHASSGFIGVWALVGLFGVLFQCHVPDTWAILSDKCFNQEAFWYAIGVLDITSDMVLIGVPIYILWDLQVSWEKKSSVMAAFGARALVIPLTILRLVYLGQASESQDQTFDTLNAALFTQISMNFALTITCFPFLRIFMDYVHNGFFVTDLRTGPGPNIMNRTGAEGYAMGSYGKTTSDSHNSSSGKRSTSASARTSLALRAERWRGDLTGAMGTVTTAIGEEAESIRSSDGSDRMIIRETRTFQVEHEELQSPRGHIIKDDMSGSSADSEPRRR